MLTVEIKGQIGSFKIDAEFSADTGVTALFGPSGAGKSTVLRAIAGLWTPQHGSISFNGDTWLREGVSIRPTEQRKIGAVFQRPLLFPHLNIKKNLLFGASNNKLPFDEVVQTLSLDGLLDRRPKNLSGGEAQRVALGRALLSQPDLLLLDEPLTGLDSARRESVFPFVEKLCRETSLPIVYVSHNSAEIARLAKRVILIDNGRTIGETSPDKLS